MSNLPKKKEVNHSIPFLDIFTSDINLIISNFRYAIHFCTLGFTINLQSLTSFSHKIGKVYQKGLLKLVKNWRFFHIDLSSIADKLKESS